jgi:hypothetical protein
MAMPQQDSIVKAIYWLPESAPPLYDFQRSELQVSSSRREAIQASCRKRIRMIIWTSNGLAIFIQTPAPVSRNSQLNWDTASPVLDIDAPVSRIVQTT